MLQVKNSPVGYFIVSAQIDAFTDQAALAKVIIIL
jgi:hypothetical protein